MRGPTGSAPRSGILSSGLQKARLPLPVLLYLVTVILPIGFHLGPLLITTLRLLLLVMIIPLLVQIFSGRHGRILPTDILFPLFVLWSVVALALNSPDQVITQTGSAGVEFLGGYALGRCYFRTSAAYLTLCRALVVAGLVFLPFALLETITGDPIIVRLLRAVPGILTVDIISYERRLGLERVQATFAHPIHFGLFCSVIFSQAFVAMRGVVSNGRRYGTSALIAFEGFLSLSSGALLSILLQFGLILWNWIFGTRRSKWLYLIGLFAFAYLVVLIFSNRPPIRVFMSYATFSAQTAYYRSMIFDFGMDNVWANPFFGIGMKDWIRPDYMHAASVDNFWLLTTMRFGIPGLVILVAGYVWPLPRIMARKFPAGSILGQIRTAWVFTFLGLSFTLATVHIWTNIYSFVFFMFGAGMWLCDVAADAPDAPPPAEASPAKPGPRYSRFAPRSVQRLVRPSEKQ